MYEDMNYEKHTEGEARMVTFSDIDYAFQSAKKPDGTQHMVPVPFEEQVLAEGQFGFKPGPWLPWESLYTESAKGTDKNPAENHRQREERICSRQEKSRQAFEKRMARREEELKRQQAQEDYLDGNERFPEMRGNMSHPAAQTLEALRQESENCAPYDLEELPFEPESNSPGMLAMLMAQMDHDELSHESMVDRSFMAQKPMTEQEARDEEEEAVTAQARPPKRRKKMSKAAAAFMDLEARCHEEEEEVDDDDKSVREEICQDDRADFLSMSDLSPDCIESPRMTTAPGTSAATPVVSPCRPPRESTKTSRLCQHARQAFQGPEGTRPYDYVGQPHRDKSLTEFIRYICQERFRNYVFIAHYGSGFDFLFVMKRMFELGVYTTFLAKGNKILGLKIPQFSIRFVDFFLYVGHSLRSIKTSMGLSCDNKGYFPFLLNTGKPWPSQQNNLDSLFFLYFFRIQLPLKVAAFA